MRKLVGAAAILLGLVGLLACVAGIACLVVYYSTVVQMGEQSLSRAEAFLEATLDQLTQAETGVRTVYQVASPAATRITALAEARKEGLTAEETAQVQTLQGKLARRIEQLEGFVEVTAAASDAMNRALGALHKVQGRSTPGELDWRDRKKDWGPRLTTLMAELKWLNETLAKTAREKRLPGDLLDRSAHAARAIEDALLGLENYLRAVRTELDTVRGDVARARTEWPRWWRWVFVLLVVVLGWIGLGQLMLLRAGLRLLGGGHRREAA